jgi:acetoin utilization deacetylase AcuC-like enzyme
LLARIDRLITFMKIITDPHCVEYSAEGHLETPRRVSGTVKLLLKHQLDRGGDLFHWGAPAPVAEAQLLRAHTPEMLKRLEEARDFDEDTPAFPGIAGFARRSAGAAVAALDSTLAGETGFSLMRPPGHHASRSASMGYCYLNNMGIAVLEARARGVERVAVFDFDVHHGNGTEDILLNESGVCFASVHEKGYPYTGDEDRGGNCYNFAALPKSSRESYRGLLEQAMVRLKAFKPALLGVSAGFDAYREDTLSEQELEVEDYHWLGQSVREFQIPVFILLEGGYTERLPELVLAFLQGVEGE